MKTNWNELAIAESLATRKPLWQIKDQNQQSWIHQIKNAPKNPVVGMFSCKLRAPEPPTKKYHSISLQLFFIYRSKLLNSNEKCMEQRKELCSFPSRGL